MKKLDSAEIKVAENGFVVNCNFREVEDEKEKGKSDHCCPSWEPPKNYVFETVDKALAYAKEMLSPKKTESLAERVKSRKAKA